MFLTKPLRLKRSPKTSSIHGNKEYVARTFSSFSVSAHNLKFENGGLRLTWPSLSEPLHIDKSQLERLLGGHSITFNQQLLVYIKSDSDIGNIICVDDINNKSVYVRGSLVQGIE